MTVINIIKNACIFLQKEGLLETTTFNGSDVATTEQQSEIDFLLRCLNLVYNEVASDYVPLLHTETLIPTDGEILLSSFTKTVLDIKRVEDKFGIRANYKLYPDRILTINEEVKITYSYEPTELIGLSSSIEGFSQKLTERVLAYGVAMEYCFINGLHDDAAIWEKRFKDALIIASRKKSGIRLPTRRWN